MLCLNFMRSSEVHSLKDINVEDRTKWIPLSDIRDRYLQRSWSFMHEVTALPQSTAAVERTFSKISNNKIKIGNALSVRIVEAIVRTSDYFSTNFDVDDKLVGLYSKTRGKYMERYNAEERSAAEHMENLN